ncbi:MAG: DUF4340 domain-containing protein [Gemmataceae bacterium]|nr:DUF4340 domain-containing protein [Gemmataceae bacterium]
MNLKTTIALLLAIAIGAGTWVWVENRNRTPAVSETIDFLEKSLVVEKIRRIEVFRGDKSQFVLEQIAGEWTLPGNWPTRAVEANQWVGLLTSLRSRYTPTTLGVKIDLKPYGLDASPLVVKVTVGDVTHTLRIAEEPTETNRFARATFLRVDEKPEVIRLGPGIVNTLDRTRQYFQQHRIFEAARVAKEGSPKDKVEQVVANAIEVVADKTKFKIQKHDDDSWVIASAQIKKADKWEEAYDNDRIDPAKLTGILAGFTDLWVEEFLDAKGKSLDEIGLKNPEFSLLVTRPKGAPIRLLIGNGVPKKDSDKEPPPPLPIKEMKPKEDTEYRYAKIETSDQIFKVKTAKLDEIAIAVDVLRDPKLARFKSDDVARLEIRAGDQTLVFVNRKDDPKDKEGKKKWRMEQPSQEEIEAKQVEDLLDKISGLQASDNAILDKKKDADFGLDKPAGRITITVEEPADPKKKDDDKKKERTIVLSLGQQAAEKDKLFVRVDGWSRINRVSDEVFTLAKRADIAYRPRELWKLERDAITRVTIEAEGKSYHLDRKDKGWRVAGPIDVEVTGSEPENLVDELVSLRAERFEARKPADLAKYGLDKPAFRVSVVVKDGSPRIIELGKREETKEGGRFARVKDGDIVFVLSDKLAANLRADPLAFLDKNLATLDPEKIERIRYAGPSSFSLERSGKQWQIVDAPIPSSAVDKDAIDSILKGWQKLRAERYVAVGPKIVWNDFGLEKATTITVSESADDGAKPKEHVIELGKDAKDGGRYARFGKKEAVVVLNGFVAEMMTRSHLDFVDTRMVRPFDPDAIALIDRKMLGGDIELTRRDDAWQFVKPTLREADNLTMFELLRRVSQLQAKRIAAVNVKDLQPYGLDKPFAVVTLNFDPDGVGKKHVIKIGNPTKDDVRGEKEERFAIVDDKPTVVVLPADLSKQLVAPSLFFADRNIASFSRIDRAELMRGSRKLALVRGDKSWQIIDPIKADADTATLDDLVRALQRLRADEIVADKGADLKKYGLDAPTAEWKFKLGEDEKLHLLIGGIEPGESGGRRYAKLGNRHTVFLVNAKLAARSLHEYRSLKVWPAFKVETVTELTVTGPTGAYTLKRKDKDWEIAGMPKASVKASAVLSLFDTLETLEAHHFAIDAKADLKSFGLEKPNWKLELSLGKEKRELLIGNLEDKSKRPFATIAGTGSVFVLDEVDNIIIARPVSAYIAEAKDEKKKAN